MNKKHIAFILAFMILFSGCSGLPNKTPLEEIQAILIVGLDTKDDQVDLTVLSVGSKPGAELNKGGESIKVYESSGRTVYEAKQKMSLYHDKHMIWAHLEYIIIGDEAARSGIAEHLDFFIRNHENRLSDELVVAKDMTAREFIKNVNTSEPKMNEKIRHLFSEVEVESVTKIVHLREWALKYQSDTMSIILPVMGTTNKMRSEDSKKEESSPKKDIRSAGYAIFNREGKMIDYASLRFSRGINWVMDKIESAVVVLELGEHEILSTEITSAKTKLEINEDATELDVNINLLFNIPEYTGKEDLYDAVYIADVKQELEQIIENEVKDTMTYLQTLNTDVTNIGDVYYHKYPGNWKFMQDQWANKFKDIKVNVVVRSTLRNTYNIVNPMRKR